MLLRFHPLASLAPLFLLAALKMAASHEQNPIDEFMAHGHQEQGHQEQQQHIEGQVQQQHSEHHQEQQQHFEQQVQQEQMHQQQAQQEQQVQQEQHQQQVQQEQQHQQQVQQEQQQHSEGQVQQQQHLEQQVHHQEPPQQQHVEEQKHHQLPEEHGHQHQDFDGQVEHQNNEEQKHDPDSHIVEHGHQHQDFDGQVEHQNNEEQKHDPDSHTVDPTHHSSQPEEHVQFAVHTHPPEEPTEQQQGQRVRMYLKPDRLLDEHLAEMPHLDPRNMSPSEKQYHLFLAHDYNQDLHLDGVEIMQSIFHDDSTELYADEVLAQKIDYLLDHFDRDRDGKLSFPEFMMSDARFTAV
ncbi:putative cyclin-dependent serine/threonine-protein kinase DDB_G0272797/DDB_G0274007 isoform X1 [Penaeus chinensis]|uniref:putative cyclin-dependent serine/threonine-protein kinase DDB_G0272797/DDB_G0274007 isoform X1 n=1 Tax=Penaeus chinensis TaxID=139456 RepID=UPI001FB7BFD2|nr:putative cyclin-dependent serine/threonine-protein kinase DDB_G0272797/DDB_G0274007 isoform X1 [Penaeus chinensis]